MNQKTIEKLRNNPFYKPSPAQRVSDDEESNLRTFGELPKNDFSIPKHPTSPKTRKHKKIEKKKA